MRMHWQNRARSILQVLPFLVSPLLLHAQESPAANEIPRDTSFTLYSAWKGIVEKYPFIKPVTAELPHGVIAVENLVYASPGNRQLRLDLFRPADNSHGRYPGVLLIHGGGWRSGNRQMEFPMAQHLAEKGYVTATVEYRLSGEALYPAAVHDIKAAIRWMRAHASEYNIDPARIAVSGCSAGGTLAALVGVTAGLPRFDGAEGDTTCSTAVQAIVDIDGIVDFTHPAESGKDTAHAPPSAGKGWFGASFGERPDLWKEASPLNHVINGIPPVLFVNSSHERFHAGRDAMIEKLTALNVSSEVHSIPNTPHPFWLFHPWFEETLKYVEGFLDKTLKGKR